MPLLYTALLAIALSISPTHAGEYTPAWDTLCARGADVTAGCAAVRARKVTDSTTAPWRAIGRVNVAGLKNRSHCTGTLISPRVVLTAAHCLYVRSRKKWAIASDVHFVAGYQRGEYLAHATATRYVVAERYDTTGPDYVYRAQDDWALIVLDTPIGATAGVLGWAAHDTGSPVTLAGYPGIRPHVLSVDRDCGVPKNSRGGALLALGCAAMKGDSGAPILVRKDGKMTVVAVLSGGSAGNNGKVTSISIPVARFIPDLQQLLDTP